MGPPLAYFITYSTYGTWLHGRDHGSVDRRHNVHGTPLLPPDRQMENRRRNALRQALYSLDEPRRGVVLRTIVEVCAHRSWVLHAAHVRMTHVHVVLAASQSPEKVMADLKAWSSRRLREVFGEDADQDRWTQHGSTRYLNDAKSLEAAVSYVVDGQGEPMSVYDSRNKSHGNEPEA